MLRPRDGEIVADDVPALSALNMRLRDDYVVDAASGVGRWNKVLEKAGINFRLTLPHVAFNRKIGEFSKSHVNPDGRVIDAATWAVNIDRWLPSSDDMLYITSLMKPVSAIGEYASWIAPPKVGIDNKPGNFEYVKLWES